MMKSLFAAAALTVSASAVLAVPVHPTSYTMLNGDSGSFTYRDDTYDAPGAPVGTNRALLTGGKGDLTDGVIATSNWNANGQTSSTPYVGWVNYNPTITFYFDSLVDFTSVTFHFDDSNGAGGVSPPSSVRVNNNGFQQGVPDPASGAPFAFTMSLASVAPTDSLQFTIFGRSSWIFVSEVTFDAPAAVPVPAAGLMLIGALGGLAALRRRKPVAL
jgi:hypothetical protein